MIKGYQADKLSKLLFNFIKIAVLATLALPLVVMQSFAYPFLVPRSVFFHIIVELIFGAYLVLSFIQPEYRFHLRRFNKIILAFFIFVLISIVSGFLGVGFFRSFWSDLARMQGIFHSLHLLAFLVVIATVFKNERQWHLFMVFSVIVSFIVSASIIIGILSVVSALAIPFERFSFWFVLSKANRIRFSGTLGNASFLAAYLLPNLFFIIYFIFKKKALAVDNWFKNFIENHGKIVYSVLGFVFFVNFLVFFKTQTRSSLLGFIAGTIFLVIVGMFLQTGKKVKALGVLFLATVILSPIFLFLVKDSNLVQNSHTLRRLSTISFTDLTTASRFLTWQASWQGLVQTPKTFIIGYGPENFYYVFDRNFPVSIYKDAGSQVWFDRAHNLAFDLVVASGILGLLSYISVFVLAAYYLIKKYLLTKDKSLAVLLSFFVAYAVQSLFTFDTLNSEIPLFLLLGFIACLVGPKESTISEKKVNLKNFYPYLTGVIIIFLIPIAVNLKILKLSNDIAKAEVNEKSSLASLEESYDLLLKKSTQPFTGKFLARQQLAYLVSDSSKKQLPILKVKDKVGQTVLQLERSIQEEPQNVKHYLILSQFLQDTADFVFLPGEKIVDISSRAVLLSPNRPQLYFQLAQGYAFMKDFPKAYESFKRGLSLAPWVIEDRWALLDLAISFGEEEVVQKEWESMQKDLMWNQESSSFITWIPVAQDYRRLAELYGKEKNYLRAVDLYKIVVEIEPSGLDYAKLAAYYAKLGLNQEAREATKEAVRLYPALFEESKYFLELLDKGELLE